MTAPNPIAHIIEAMDAAIPPILGERPKISATGQGVRLTPIKAQSGDEWATAINAHRHDIRFGGIGLVECARPAPPHIILELTDAAYDFMLNALLSAHTDISPPDIRFVDDEARMELILRQKAPRAVVADKDAFLARIAYVRRRMWMLSRQAEGEPHCPAHAREALMYTALALAKSGGFHALNACDALLSMTYGRPPGTNRRVSAAHVAKAAAGALSFLYRQEVNQ